MRKGLIYGGVYLYDCFTITVGQLIMISNVENCLENNCILRLDSVFFHYLFKELKQSEFYRGKFKKKHKQYKVIKFILLNTKYDLIDYNWNQRINEMVHEKRELDGALSWLSTFGGAFSALGDCFPDCAHMAGKISIRQLQLAIRLNDETIISRCKLFFSLSLIQRKRFKMAKRIIVEEFEKTKRAIVIDDRLVRMCKGIWAKLQYDYLLFRHK